jgi:hypothetical protein
MAKCDEGYRCDVCGSDVESILDSALYLRYILCEIPLERLHLQSERHIACDPTVSQYIVDPSFPPVVCDGVFDKRLIDVDYVKAEEERITRGWQRLNTIPTLGIGIAEYPLPS